MFPRVKEVSNNSTLEYSVDFYTKNQTIEIDKHKCVGCGICTKACPKEAIKTPLRKEKGIISKLELIPEIPNPNNCSYCGTCVYLCPFDALTLKKNGEKIEKNDLKIVKNKVVPELTKTMRYCENIFKKIGIYFEGDIDFDYDKCTSCFNCVEICPTGAVLMVDKSEEHLVYHNVILDDKKCIKCGTCQLVCSKKAIQVSINKLNYSGEYKEIFWDELIGRLTN
ncbi:MAG: 4Fe-4S binding protein [Candidatus Lokiarchaeota archaeon]